MTEDPHHSTTGAPDDPATASVETRPGRDLLALLLTVPAPSVGVIAAMILWPGTVGKVIYSLCKVWMLAMPLFWLVCVEKKRISLSPARHGGFGVAIAIGVAIGAVIWLAYLLLGPRLIDYEHMRAMATKNGIGEPALYIVGLTYWICINSVLEEYVYRWFIFRRSEGLVGGTGAVLLSALFFTVHHVIALAVQFDWTVTILGSTGVFIGGAIWSWMYLKYRSIWPGYVSHAIVDVAVFGVGWVIIFG